MNRQLRRRSPSAERKHDARNPLLIIAAIAFAAPCSANDTFDAAELVTGTRVVSSTLDDATPGADTSLGVYNTGGLLTLVDADSSFFGNGHASAILGEPIDGDSIRFRVSGDGDFDFDGQLDGAAEDHAQAGDVQVFLTVYASDGRVVDSEQFDETLTPGGVLDFGPLSNPAWAGGSYDLEINNFFGPPSDVDFWRFGGLPPGAVFDAEIIGADFDTVLALYNASGEAVAADDDGGVGVLSRLAGLTPASGEVVLAVTAFPDYGFAGVHSVNGQYELRLTVIPEPGTVTVMLAAALTVSRRRGRAGGGA